MIEIWKAIGMDMTNVRFLWASDEINSHAGRYIVIGHRPWLGLGQAP